MPSNANPDVTRILAGAFNFFDNITDLIGGDEKGSPSVVEYTLASDIKIGQQVVLPSGEYTHVTGMTGDQDVVELEFATGEYFSFLTNSQVRTR